MEWSGVEWSWEEGRRRREMVQLTSASILRYNGTSADPYLLGTATDLSTFNYFQRSSVREMLAFTSRTVARRTPENTRQSVEHQVRSEKRMRLSLRHVCTHTHAHTRTHTRARACMHADARVYTSRTRLCAESTCMCVCVCVCVRLQI